METISINEILKSVKKLKKLLKGEAKQPLSTIEEFCNQQLFIQKTVFKVPAPVLEVKDIKVDEQVQSPKDVEVTLEGEPDLDLIQEQDASGLN